MPRLVGEQLQFPEAPAIARAISSPNRRRTIRRPLLGKPLLRRSTASSANSSTTEGALLTRSHLRELGLERRAVDAVFRALPVVALPGYSRPMIRADEYLALVEKHTYRDDRVRPTRA